VLNQGGPPLGTSLILLIILLSPVTAAWGRAADLQLTCSGGRPPSHSTMEPGRVQPVTAEQLRYDLCRATYVLAHYVLHKTTGHSSVVDRTSKPPPRFTESRSTFAKRMRTIALEARLLSVCPEQHTVHEDQDTSVARSDRYFSTYHQWGCGPYEHPVITQHSVTSGRWLDCTLQDTRGSINCGRDATYTRSRAEENEFGTHPPINGAELLYDTALAAYDASQDQHFARGDHLMLWGPRLSRLAMSAELFATCRWLGVRQPSETSADFSRYRQYSCF